MHLQYGDDLSEGIRRLMEEQVSSCQISLKDLQLHNLHETLHELRKSFKKLRAILRLIRPLIMEENYQKNNVFYRDLGREISEVRDSTAILEALQQLKLSCHKNIDANEFNIPLRSLAHNRKKLENEFLQRKRLDYIRKQLQYKLPEPVIGGAIQSFEQLLPGLKKIYKTGQQALHLSQTTRATEHLHDWRKKVKYLLYQLDIFLPVPPQLKRDLDILSNLLGVDHDFSIIEKQIGNNMVEFESAPEQALLTALLSYRRNQLQTKALAKGQHFYQENPDVFVEKINTYWSEQ